MKPKKVKSLLLILTLVSTLTACSKNDGQLVIKDSMYRKPKKDIEVVDNKQIQQALSEVKRRKETGFWGLHGEKSPRKIPTGMTGGNASAIAQQLAEMLPAKPFEDNNTPIYDWLSLYLYTKLPKPHTIMGPTKGNVKKRVSSAYGYRNSSGRLHRGIDVGMVSEAGIHQLTPWDGQIKKISYHNSMGHYVEVDHGGTLITRYLHLNSKIPVTEGQKVVAGEQIGIIDGSGFGSNRGYPIHIHFELDFKEQPRNPWIFLTEMDNIVTVPGDFYQKEAQSRNKNKSGATRSDIPPEHIMTVMPLLRQHFK